jgi:flagella synthesis protein FlgN
MQQRRQQTRCAGTTFIGTNSDHDAGFCLAEKCSTERMEADWATLEKLVIECKRLSKRNGDLLVEQYSIMQRVLHGEEQIYAPA